MIWQGAVPRHMAQIGESGLHMNGLGSLDFSYSNDMNLRCEICDI